MQKYLFPTTILFLFAYRFFHFENIIDEPHAWRQYDTLVYIQDFYQHKINLLRPSVCWMGGYKTLLLEFPLYEAIVAFFYKILGESLIWARLSSLIFFAGASFYLYKIIEKLFSERIAEYSTILFVAMPLSLFYSRAIQIDFMVLFFSHAMLWYILLGYEKGNFRSFLTGIGFACLAFVCKAPMPFCLLFPLSAYIFIEKKIKISFKWSLFWLIPMSLMFFWIHYSKSINEQAPDWQAIIPGFHKFTNMNHWYYGTVAQRLEWANWVTIAKRVYQEILSGMGGVLFLLAGLWAANSFKNRWLLWTWIAGTFLYLSIFFNLNLHHNYYQIPFLAPFALTLGISIHSLSDFLQERSLKTGFIFYIPYFFMAVFIFFSLKTAEKEYYKIDVLSNKIAHQIAQNTPTNALVINSFSWQDKYCPLVLAPAQRFGWSIPESLLKAELVANLQKQGANYLAITLQNDVVPDTAYKNFTLVKKENLEGWNFYLYKL